MNPLRPIFAVALSTMLVAPPASFAASHREAPITALDHQADITDVFAFVSYDDPSKVTLILDVNGFLDPANGPNYFPFDPEITYAINIDNNNSATAAISFQFKFTTEIRAPGVFTGFIGAGNGINVPSNAPAGAPAVGAQIIPPAITALDGPGSAGLSLRQHYTVSMVTGNGATSADLTGGSNLYAVPSNVGPRTMPNYPALAAQGIYSLGNGVRVWAGTADDPFYIDVGAIFDTVNLRGASFPSGVPGVLTAAQDAATANTAPDALAGFNVNVIAIEVPIAMLTSSGKRVSLIDPAATIGVWATTSRPSVTVRTAPGGTAPASPGNTGLVQIQRMGNPLINEVLIGTGDKDLWSMTQPVNDSQFAHYALDPLLPRALNAAYSGALKVPPPPRTDLLPLMQYMPPIALAATSPGPIADLLRLNTGIGPTPASARSRLGILAGDSAGFPNGRRVSDDVTDIALRVVAGGVLVPGFNIFPNNALGDGVNSNDVPYQETFPYVAWAHSGLSIPNGGTGAVPPVTPPNPGSEQCVRDPLSCTGN